MSDHPNIGRLPEQTDGGVCVAQRMVAETEDSDRLR